MSLVSVCLKKHPDWCQCVRQDVRTSVAWPRLQEPWLPCFPVILVGAGFRGGGEAPVLLASPWGVTSKQPQVSSPSRHQHHKGRQPQDQPSRGCAVSLWQCSVHRGLQGSPPEARSPGCRGLASSPAQGHRRPAPYTCAHTFQLRLKCPGLSPEPGRAPCAGNNSQQAGSPLRRASTAPVSAARLGVHTVAPWGGGLVVILDPVAPGACRVTKPGSGDPARGPGRCALGFGATRLRARGLVLCFPGRLACCCLDVCAFPLACAGPCPGPGLLSSSLCLHCAPRETSAVLSSCWGFGPEKSGGN